MKPDTILDAIQKRSVPHDLGKAIDWLANSTPVTMSDAPEVLAASTFHTFIHFTYYKHYFRTTRLASFDENLGSEIRLENISELFDITIVPAGQPCDIFVLDLGSQTHKLDGTALSAGNTPADWFVKGTQQQVQNFLEITEKAGINRETFKTANTELSETVYCFCIHPE